MEELELLIQAIRNRSGFETPAVIERRVELAIAEFQAEQAGEALRTSVGIPGRPAEESLEVRETLLRASREAEEQRNLRQVALDRALREQTTGRETVPGSIEDFTAVQGRFVDSPISGGLGLRPAVGEEPLDVQAMARAEDPKDVIPPEGTIVPTAQRQTPAERGFVPSDSVVPRGFVPSDSVVAPVSPAELPEKIDTPEIGEIAAFPVDIPTPKELAERADIDLATEVGQLMNTFATDALSFVGEPGVFAMAREGAERGQFLGPVGPAFDELQRQADIDGYITLDDIIGQSERGMAIPFGSLDPRDDPHAPGIRPIRGPVGTGIMGGITVSAINLTKQMINDPVMTTLGLVTAPAVITYQGLLEGAQNFVFPGTTLTEFQNNFFDFYGRMTYHEAMEARRAFNGLLATTVFARGLGVNGLGIPATRAFGGRGRRVEGFRRVGRAAAGEEQLIFTVESPAITGFGRRGAPRRGIVHAFAQSARGTGLSRAEALAVGELRANQITTVGALSTFGFFAAEPGRRQEKALGFALAAIPLGLSFTAMQFLAGRAIGLNNMIARAAHTSQSRSARPLDTVTPPRPTVSTDTGAIPMGGEVSAPLETPIRTTDVHSHPDFARRVPRDEAARTAATREVQERESGLLNPEDPALDNATRNERRREAQRRRFDIDERRRTDRREAERRAGPEVEEAVRAERPEERRVAEERRGVPRDLVRDEINRELVQGIQEELANTNHPISQIEGQRVTSPEVAILIGEAKTRHEVENILIESLRDTNLSTKEKSDIAVALSQRMIEDAIRNRETLRGPDATLSDREGFRRAEDQLKDDLGEILLNFTEFMTEEAFSRVISREFLNRLARATSEAERTVLIQEALRGTDLSRMPELFDSVIDRMSIAAQRAAERPEGFVGPLRELDEALRIELADIAEMARGPVPVNVPIDFMERVAKSKNQNQIREMVQKELMSQTEFPEVVQRELSNQVSEVLFEILVRDRQERLTREQPVRVDVEATGEDLITMVREFDTFIPPELQEQLLTDAFVRRVAEAKDRAALVDIFQQALKDLELPGVPGEAKRTLIDIITKDLREKAVARSGGVVRPEQRGLQRRTGGRREGEPREERRGPSRPLAFQGTNQGNIAREIVFSALRGANGDVILARQMLRNAERFMRESGNEMGALIQAEAVTLLEKLVPPGVEKISELEGQIIRERRGTGRVTQADIAAYEAAAMTAKELLQLEIDKIARRRLREDEILGKEVADEWRRLIDFRDTKASTEEAIVANRRIQEIEAQLSIEDKETLANIGVERDNFGAERFTIPQIRFLAHTVDRNSHKFLQHKTVDEVASRALNEILNPKRTEDTGVQLAESTIILRAAFDELITHRGLTREQVIQVLAERYVAEITPTPDFRLTVPEAKRIIERQLAEVQGTQATLENIPRQTEVPDLVPTDIAADLHNWVENGGDLVETLVGQVLLRDNQTVVIDNLDVPTEVFLAAARQLPPDITVAVHVKSDGTFDVAVGGDGSPLNFSFLNRETGQIEFPWRDQFINDGFFRGQTVSFNGRNHQYVGTIKDANGVPINVTLLDTRLNETFEADASAIRRIKNVEFMDQWQRVADAQRGLPERAMLRVQEAQIANIYHHLLEHAGDLTHRMSDAIEFAKGQWSAVLEKINRLELHLFNEFGFEREMNEQISTNHIVKSNPNATSEQMRDLIRTRRETPITRDPSSLTEAEFAEYQRLQQISQEYADAHRQIPVINDVQRMANDIAIAMGEFRFEDARTLVRELKEILDKGPENWERVARENDTPTARQALEGILSEQEIVNYERLRREVRPPSAEAMEGRTLTEENVRMELNSNGYELERNAAGAWTVRDYQTGTEQFVSTNLRDVRDFNNRSGQREDVVIDGNTPIDNDIPGGVTPPLEPPARPNEPMGFDEPTLFERFGEAVNAMLPQWFPAKDWFAGVDGVAGTNAMGEVFNPTLNGRRRSSAAAEPWRKILKEISDAMRKARVTAEEALHMFVHTETRSYADLIGSHKEGLGPLVNRSATEAEINAANLLASYNVDSSRPLSFVRRKQDAIALERRRGPVSQDRIREIDTELKTSMGLSPFEEAAVALFELLRVESRDTHDIGVIVRIADAKRLETLSQADYAVANGMRPEVVELARQIDQMMRDMAELEGSPISDVQEIRGYMARYAQDQTADPSSINLGQPGSNRNIDFVNAMSRTGELDAYSKDPIATTARYINGFFNAMEIEGNISFNRALDNARTYVKENFGEGTTPRAVSDAYLSSVQGNLPAMSRWSEKIFTKFFNELGIKFLKGFKIRDLVDSYMAMTHAAYIGWRVGLAGRDLMQFTFSHYARTGNKLGGGRTARALQLAHESKGEVAQALKESGDLPTIGITEFQSPSELMNSTLGRGLQQGPRALRAMAESALVASQQRNAYEFSYRGTLLEGREFYGNALTEMVKNGTPRAEVYADIKLDTFSRSTRKLFDELVLAEKYTEAANMLAKQLARDIMGEYGAGQHPWGWNTNLGRAVTQYGQWSSNASAMTLAGATRGSKATRMGFATRLAMSQAALFVTGRTFGINFSRWFFIPGLFFTGGPALQTANLVVKAVFGYGEEKDEARQRLNRQYPEINFDDPTLSDVRSLFPGSYATQDILFFMNAIDRGEALAPTLARLFSIPIDRKQSVLDGGKIFQ